MVHFRRSTLTYLLIVTLLLTVLVPTNQAHAASLKDLLKADNPSSVGSLIDMIGSLLLGKDKWHKLRNIGDWMPSANNKDNDNDNDPKIPQTSSRPKEFVGFYAEWWGNDTSSYTTLVQHADTIHTIAPFWATLDGDAQVSDRGGSDHASVVRFAKNNNVQVLLLINNEKKEEANPPIQKVLSNAYLRGKAIDNIEGYIKKYRLDGVNIDFEMVPAGQRDNLTLFMKELYSRFHPQGYIVSIDVFPKQDETIDVSIAYDYEKLAQYADKIMIMTYDNHAAWSGAGPIAGIGWAENNLKYALKFIPKEKLYLGVAAYGYDWSYGKNGKKVESLDYKAVAKLVKKYGVPVKWDEPAKSPYFAYTASDGVKHTVWFENSRSLKSKLDLVAKYDLAGAAMWKLGEEDPGYWDALKSMFKKSNY